MENSLRYAILLIGTLALAGSYAPEARCQDGVPADNLVPNPGFEAYAIPPIGWFYRGLYFSKVMKFWTSPTAASPDAYGPRTRIPAHWAEQGFGDAEPYRGASMVGLTLYGCRDGKPHCREYLQALLNEPLLPGQAYAFSFWVKPLARGLRIDRLGAAFGAEEERHRSDTLLARPPAVYLSERTDSAGGWQQLHWVFTPEAPADYLLIGNFFPDDSTRTLAVGDDPLPFAYYYIDEVRLQKVPPFLDQPEEPVLVDPSRLTAGAVIPLDRIYFDFDRDELLPRSYRQLEALYRLLAERPGLRVQINGHTDYVGDAAYNLDLSQRRAAAVVGYLIDRGIAADRLRSRGFGASRPRADNATEAGRRQNRRVEFEVLDP